MNYLAKIFTSILFVILIFFEFNVNAQIQDIKKHSNENKTNQSNNKSNNNNSNNSNNDNSDFASGCFSSFFDIFTGCLMSLPEKDNNVSNSDDFIVVIPDDNNQNNNNNNNNQNFNNINNIDDSIKYKPKAPQEFSLDLNANFAIGYQYGTDTSYTYYHFLPGIRANIAWFIIDYRYNMLTEINDILPDAFKTWDLLFLFKINANPTTKIILGTGMHHEEYSGLTFNQHFLGAKIGMFDNRDFLNIEGRLTVDYQTDEFPFNEVGVHYNRRIINTKQVNGYISVGGLYQNYYSAIDIWSIRAGICINWHN